MARPLRLSQTAAPKFSSADLGTAVDAFRGAGQGFSRFSDTMGEFEQREDDQLTNEAIAARLRGEEVPFNRRVDQEAVRASFDARRLNESNLDSAEVARTGAGLTQEGQVLSNEAKTFANSKQEEVFKSSQAESKARTRASKVLADTRESQESRAAAASEVTLLEASNAKLLDDAAFDAENEIYQNKIDADIEEVEANYRAANPAAEDYEIEAELERFREVSRTEAKNEFGSNADTWLDQYSRDNNISPQARARSTVGREDARLKDEAVTRAGEAAALQKTQQTARAKNVDDAKANGGNNNGIIATADGYRIADSASERTGNKLSDTADDVGVWLDSHGIPDSEENIKQAKRLITASGNNRSVMDFAIQGDDVVDRENKDGIPFFKKSVPLPKWDAIEKQMKVSRAGTKTFAQGYVDPVGAPADPAATTASFLANSRRGAADEGTRAAQATAGSTPTVPVANTEPADVLFDALTTAEAQQDQVQAWINDDTVDVSSNQEEKLNRHWMIAHEGRYHKKGGANISVERRQRALDRWNTVFQEVAEQAEAADNKRSAKAESRAQTDYLKERLQNR